MDMLKEIIEMAIFTVVALVCGAVFILPATLYAIANLGGYAAVLTGLIVGYVTLAPALILTDKLIKF